ncbi:MULTISPECIES: hypothetical protein [unclassified Streptomyces]|uniref:hypothetical protein n=1 Tax=unclassified Streptomyces TaxID=2593676 RepID=UPI00278C3E88|nr:MULTISPECIES: hypothetical protein [unclassified Streptomyces]
MPFRVKVWVEDCDDGRAAVYVDKALLHECGPEALEDALNDTARSGQKVDSAQVRATLRAVSR